MKGYKNDKTKTKKQKTKKNNTKEHHPNWLQIPDHPQRILIIGVFLSGNTNSLFQLISQQLGIDKI